MDDLISRQAAIDAVCKCTNIYVTNLPVMVDKADAYKALAELPSAQPEIIRCKDCIYWDFSGYCVDFMTQDENGFCSWAERRTDDEG